MLAAFESVSQPAIFSAANTALLVAGGLCAAGYVAWLVLNGRWRNPLSGVHPRLVRVLPEAALFEIMAPVALYLLVPAAVLPLMLSTTDQAELATPGSHAWHVAGVAAALGKVISAALMVVILWKTPAFPALERRANVVALAGVVFVGTMAVTTVCLLQLEFTNRLWEWAGNAKAVHPVFEAYNESAWGDWGRVWLIVSPVVIAPLWEELMFRGILLQLVWRITGQAWVAVITSALAFGFMHLGVLPSVLPLCTFGLVLGYIRLRYRSLTVCVLIHALFNARPMILVFVSPELAGQ